MTKILLVGCGKMGGALLEGWLERGQLPQDVLIVDPGEDVHRLWHDRIVVVKEHKDIPPSFQPDVVLLGVKPQVMLPVIVPYADFKSALFISIAAGKTTHWLKDQLGKDRSVIRVMPNTPAAVRRGVSVAYATADVTQEQRDVCTALLEAVGTVIWIDDESQLDAVTALSGGGPAYVFLLAECLTQAGIDAGLPADMAAQLARDTVAGSGELLHRSPETPETLRRNVTSPQGTTFAALQVLMSENGMTPLFSQAIQAATKRSRELAE